MPHGLFIPQILRGAGTMLCLLPTTTLALESQPLARAADASGLFNMMRNLGGAIGIALVDTIAQLRTPVHADQLAKGLQNHDVATAAALGLPIDKFLATDPNTVDQATRDTLRPLIEHAAATASFNEAWLMLGGIVFAVIVVVAVVPAG